MTYHRAGIDGQVSTPRTGSEPVPLVVQNVDPDASGETALLPKYPMADHATYGQFMPLQTRVRARKSRCGPMRPDDRPLRDYCDDSTVRGYLDVPSSRLRGILNRRHRNACLHSHVAMIGNC